MENLDQTIVFSLFGIPLDATLCLTWLVMAILVAGSVLVGRSMSGELLPGRYELFLEALVTTISAQIEDVTRRPDAAFLPYVGTLFLFIATANLIGIIPGLHPPTLSLSTTVALALSVFLAVPLYGIAQRGLLGYLRQYLEPTFVMLPLNVLGEFSRTLALAVRLYGNVMGGAVVTGILLSIAPFIFPMIMQLFELLIGFIQAYIFGVLAMVYIASALGPEEQPPSSPPQSAA
jgi:F-type H+-transporting ATPase subunit a